MFGFAGGVRKLAFLGGFLTVISLGGVVTADEQNKCSDVPSLREMFEFWDDLHQRCPREVERLWIQMHGYEYHFWRLRAHRLILTEHDIGLD
jgi:hypothetical protein